MFHKRANNSNLSNIDILAFYNLLSVTESFLYVEGFLAIKFYFLLRFSYTDTLLPISTNAFAYCAKVDIKISDEIIYIEI